ncbi:hypothetical protein [Sinorhizobium sp. RAC02]|uniref:hypothetical protein n=1 Tax=Sinorhizobium sp. RAC02 TaxID=1842534 RepID=UPI00083CC045|nr:hypothetical protein [Sinorhizobium sp. RAC02]AOF92360.1 hypothetical protein BSY16_6148 [Sinorhizobium sp. RAC02]
MTSLDGLVKALSDCLEADATDEALIALIARPFEIASLETGQQPQLALGVAATLMAGALLRLGRHGEVAPLFIRLNDELSPPGRKGEGYWRLLNPFHFLPAPLIDAALALQDQTLAVSLLNGSVKELTRAKPVSDPLVSQLLAHPKAASYGPFHIDVAWLLDRHEHALGLGELDHRLVDVQKFHAGYVQSALLAEAPQRAMPLIEQELEWYLSCPVLDTSHFEFNAICTLATLGQFDEALSSAKRLVRRGYHLPWRFSLEIAERMAWTQAMRQNDWLAELAETPAYQRFLMEDSPGPLLDEAPEGNPLCLVKDGVWTGKKDKRCVLSRKPIKPGEPVVRFRKLFCRASDGGLEMATREVFEASAWQTAREQFENDAIPLRLLFPRNATVDAKLDGAPYIHSIAHDLARDPGSLNIAQVVAAIADHAPPPIAYSWDKGNGLDRWTPAFPPLAGADGHGDAVNMTWRLIKAGFREQIIEAAQALPQAKADKVFAMIATFDDFRLRQAAATHFDLPDLPRIMAVAFKDRLALEDHEVLAVFGSDNTRYRVGLTAAMQAYGLHLYSNYRPKPDWFLAGLRHYVNAGGSALLYFLIDHPEEDPVLDTIVVKGWLPDKCGGNTDEYANTRPFYLRAALFHLARHKPEQLDAWLTPVAVARWSGMAYDRETLRLIKKRRRSGHDVL